MSAKIIQFPVKAVEEWPDGTLGKELTALAEIIWRRAHERGKAISMDHARRAVLAALREAFQ